VEGSGSTFSFGLPSGRNASGNGTGNDHGHADLATSR
jgi:hypothetical protein